MDLCLARPFSIKSGNIISALAPRFPVHWHQQARNSYSPNAGKNNKRMQSAVSCHPQAPADPSPAVEIKPSFEPSVWGDFFIHYEPMLQRSDEWMRERANKLKEDVRTLFAASKDILETMKLVDTIQHLGIDHLFEKEFEVALKDIHENEFDSSNLHDVALRFRLLRERGFWISPDVFNKFKGDDGIFRHELANDPKGLLSLYNAGYLYIHGEPELEEAISFARRHLESAITRPQGVMKAPLADRIKRALHIPLPRTHRRVVMVSYIPEYDKEDGHNPILLELAKLDFNILQRVHQKELKELSSWWNHVSAYMGLHHTRDRLIENYTWSYAAYHEEEFSVARVIFAKIAVLITLLDDTYDVYAYTSIEECRLLNAAFQGWDGSAAALVPEYLRKFYEITLICFREFGELIPSNQKYLVAFSKTELGSQNKADMPCSVQTYINEYKVPAAVAIAKINELVEEEWKTMNQSRIEHRHELPVVQRLINISLVVSIYYIGEKDGLTFPEGLQDVLQRLYVKPISIYRPDF